jgi:hypothetical protein
MTPSAMREVLNDAISLYFADATLASAFVARWCVGSKVATTGGVFHVPEDEPAPRGWRGSAPDAVNANQTQFGTRIRGRNLTKPLALVVSERHRRPDHVQQERSGHLGKRGTLAGHML